MLDNLTPQQEKALVKRAVHDSAAFQMLYEIYFKRVYSYVATKVNSQLDAEDLVADIFLQVVKGLPQFKNHRDFSFGAWVFTIARNRVIDFYRQQAQVSNTYQINTLETDIVDPVEIDKSLLEDENATELLSKLKLIPERRREVIILKYFSGLRNQQIAQILDLDERTIASHLSRGLRDLHALYTKKQESE